jgi:hypothetical protein
MLDGRSEKYADYIEKCIDLMTDLRNSALVGAKEDLAKKNFWNSRKRGPFEIKAAIESTRPASSPDRFCENTALARVYVELLKATCPSAMSRFQGVYDLRAGIVRQLNVPHKL